MTPKRGLWSQWGKVGGGYNLHRPRPRGNSREPGPGWARRGGEVRKPQGLLQVSVQREGAHGRSLAGTSKAMHQLHWLAGVLWCRHPDSLWDSVAMEDGGLDARPSTSLWACRGLAPPERVSTLPLRTD